MTRVHCRRYCFASILILLAIHGTGCKVPPVSGEPEGEGAMVIEGEGMTEGEGSATEGENEGEGEGEPQVGLPVCDRVCGFKVVNEYPHDPQAFTQGLVYHNGDFIEGTGLWEQSDLRQVNVETGVVQRRVPLTNNSFCQSTRCFGEGITLFADRIIQLTWTSKRGFVYDLHTFQLVDEFDYDTEGWGITHDGARLIMSDGTSNLYFLNPITFEKLGSVVVKDGGVPVTELNELEYVNGEVLANVWQTDQIARIDPNTGTVNGWIDLTGLLAREDRPPGTDVLNGIAYDKDNDRLFVTGKRWPKMFEITLKP